MTPDERMAYLRERGIEITTPEERKASMMADALQEANLLEQQQGEQPVSYVLIPADTSKPLQQLSFVPPRGVSSSDQLAVHLKRAFRNNAEQVDLSLLNKRDGAPHLLGSDGSPASVSDSTLREVAAQGNVEVFSLVHPTASNQFTGTSMLACWHMKRKSHLTWLCTLYMFSQLQFLLLLIFFQNILAKRSEYLS